MAATMKCRAAIVLTEKQAVEALSITGDLSFFANELIELRRRLRTLINEIDNPGDDGNDGLLRLQEDGD